MKTKKISINELRSIIKEIIKEEIEKTNKSVNEIQYDRYIVGYFNPQDGGGVEGMGMHGMMNDFDSYSKAKDYAKKAYKEDPNYIYVVMDFSSRENRPIFTIGKQTPTFKNWLKNQ